MRTLKVLVEEQSPGLVIDQPSPLSIFFIFLPTNCLKFSEEITGCLLCFSLHDFVGQNGKVQTAADAALFAHLGSQRLKGSALGLGMDWIRRKTCVFQHWSFCRPPAVSNASARGWSICPPLGCPGPKRGRACASSSNSPTGLRHRSTRR